MRKLIEYAQESIIQCDNNKCDFKIPNTKQFSSFGLKSYVDMPCPLCGENLLTQEDYIHAQTFLKVVSFLNKWFSWITIFMSKSKYVKATVHCHKGINITKE